MSEGLLELLSVLSTMRNYGDKWTSAHDYSYALGLRSVPASDCRALAAAALVAFAERPCCKELLELHRKITHPDEDHALVRVRSRLYDLVRRYGPNGAAHPRFPDRRNIRTAGAPPEFYDLPEAAQLTIAAYGGWPVFATTFDFNNTSDTAQFRDMYNSVCSGASDAAVRQIAIEYQASRPRELPEVAAQSPRTVILDEERRSDGFRNIGEVAAAIAQRASK